MSIYQYLQTFAKFINVVLLVAIKIGMDNNSENSINGTNNTGERELITTENYTITLIVSLVIFACQLYINMFIQKYYKLLPTNNERNLLRRQRSSL